MPSNIFSGLDLLLWEFDCAKDEKAQQQMELLRRDKRYETCVNKTKLSAVTKSLQLSQHPPPEKSRSS